MFTRPSLQSRQHRWVLLCLLFCLLAGVAQAAPAGKAYMSIIIDDLGQSPDRDGRTLALPGPVTMAIRSKSLS